MPPSLDKRANTAPVSGILPQMTSARATVLTPALPSNHPSPRLPGPAAKAVPFTQPETHTKADKPQQASKQQVSLANSRPNHLLLVKQDAIPDTLKRLCCKTHTNGQAVFYTARHQTQHRVQAAAGQTHTHGKASFVVVRVSAVVLSIQGKFALPIPLCWEPLQTVYSSCLKCLYTGPVLGNCHQQRVRKISSFCMLNEKSNSIHSPAVWGHCTDCRKQCEKIWHNIDQIANLHITLTEWGMAKWNSEFLCPIQVSCLFTIVQSMFYQIFLLFFYWHHSVTWTNRALEWFT